MISFILMKRGSLEETVLLIASSYWIRILIFLLLDVDGHVQGQGQKLTNLEAAETF